MTDDSLTHADLAQVLGVSVTTIKSYRAKFPEFIPVLSRGKPIRFGPTAAAVCRRIREGFEADLSAGEIRERLERDFPAAYTGARRSPPAGRESLAHAQELGASLFEAGRALQLASQSQERILERLEKLQATMDGFCALATGRDQALQRGFEHMVEAWSRTASELAPRSPRDGPSPLASGRKKIVTVRNVFGGETRYEIETLGAPEPTASAPIPPPSVAAPPPGDAQAATPWAQAEDAVPDTDFLSLPLVVRSGQTEYLGVAGRAERHFCLQDLLALIERSFAGPSAFRFKWSVAAPGWRLLARQAQADKPQDYGLWIERIRTPRGNDVALLTRFEINGAETPSPNLYVFIRQMKALEQR